MSKVDPVSDALNLLLENEISPGEYVAVVRKSVQDQAACERDEGEIPRMTAGMAEVIGAHSGHTLKMPHDPNAPFLVACNGCGDERPKINELGNVRSSWQWHDAHVAEELAKAGYGKLAPHGVD